MTPKEMLLELSEMGFSQSKIARELGAHQSKISRICSGAAVEYEFGKSIEVFYLAKKAEFDSKESA